MMVMMTDDDEGLFAYVYLKWKANPARNDSRSRLLTRSGGRSFQSLVVLRKREFIHILRTARDI